MYDHVNAQTLAELRFNYFTVEVGAVTKVKTAASMLSKDVEKTTSNYVKEKDLKGCEPGRDEGSMVIASRRGNFYGKNLGTHWYSKDLLTVAEAQLASYFTYGMGSYNTGDPKIFVKKGLMTAVSGAMHKLAGRVKKK